MQYYKYKNTAKTQEIIKIKGNNRDLDDMKKLERAKTNLENDGYALKDAICSVFTDSFTYTKTL